MALRPSAIDATPGVEVPPGDGQAVAYGLAGGSVPDLAVANAAAAAPLDLGRSILSEIKQLGDRGWYAVDLLGGHTYAFRQGGDTLTDPWLQLHSSDGQLVAANDDESPFIRDSLIIHTPTVSGRYFLESGAWRDALTGTYLLLATDLTPAPAADDFGADVDHAGLLAVGSKTGGVLGQNGDHDWFRVAVQSGHSYLFRVDASTLADPTLSLRDARGLELAFNDDATDSSSNSLISYRASTTGVVFLDVGAFGDGCTGTYTVGATDLNPTPPVVSNSFSSQDGYGEVNAARAVEALVSHPISRVAALGGVSWGLDRLEAASVWAAGFTGVGVTVAVVDSGMDMDHSELDAAIWTNPREVAGNGLDDDGNGFIDDVHGWDFVNSDADPTDLNGHGTFVAGIVAAEKNGVGPTGVAYGASIMPIRVLDASGNGSYTTMIKGIHYATANGARVINLSLGGRQASPELLAAIRDAEAAGVLVVMAAGNNGSPVPSFPAAYAGQIGLAVGAIDATGTLAGFSNRAGDVTIDYVSAPGVSVVSTILNNQTATWTGTSMAAAHVAGVAALLLSARPTLSPSELVALLVGSARHGVTAGTVATAGRMLNNLI